MSVLVCAECGERNAANTQFCGRCGAFLEWNAEAPAAPAPAAEEPVPVAAPQALRPDQVGVRRERDAVTEPAELAPGEEPCPRCRVGNGPGRRFCRACGLRLAVAPVAEPVRLPWWRRALRYLFRRRTYPAGHRRRRVLGAVRSWPPIVFILIAVLVLASVVPAQRLAERGATAVRDRFSDHVVVTPVAARASSSASGKRPEYVFDGLSDRFWAPSGKAEGAWIELDLPRPVRLLDLVVTGGIAPDKSKFLTQGRPHEVRVTVWSRSAPLHEQTLVLQDKPEPQRFTVKAADAVKIRLTVLSAYGMGPARLCGVAEVEVFARG